MWHKYEEEKQKLKKEDLSSKEYKKKIKEILEKLEGKECQKNL